MNYREYIQEVSLNTNPELRELFNKALAQVFSSSFINRMDTIIKKSIDVREKEERGGVVAFHQGNVIYVNPKEFYEREKPQQIRYLLHEFMHVLQKRRGIFFRRFREIKKLTIELNRILKKHLKKPLSVFLTGKNQDLGPGGKWEILSYLMNDSIDWNAITDQGKNEFVKVLRSSGIFNLEHPFWKKRLS